jgi:hypothetical protein
MMMMTAKVNIKKVLIGLIAAAALIIALISLAGGDNTDPAAVTTMSDNDSRVQFLQDLGWQVTTSPKEASQVRIPSEQSPVYSRYNDLQKSQGYDLSQYAGKTVMRYVYEVNNYPNAEQPVYATLLVYKNQIIGGDVTDTAAKGVVQGLKSPDQTMPTTAPTESSDPSEESSVAAT